MARLLFVAGEYPPDVGGLADYTLRLREALDRLGCPSDVLTRQGRAEEGGSPDVYRRVQRWDARALPWLLRLAPRAGIVHIQYQPAAFDLLGDVCLMPLVLRLVRQHVSVVTTFHDVRVPFLFRKAGPLRWQAVRLLARTSHAVLAADERDILALGGPSPRHHQVPIGSNVACCPPPGYDRAAFRAQLGLGPDDLAIVYFGLLNASKGLDTLISTVERVAQRRPATRLLLVGGAVGASDPTDRSTAARARAELDRLGGRVLATGYRAPVELAAYLLAADVALLPYLDGASPRRGSLLACAEHGLPIVSTTPVSPQLADAVRAAPPGDVAGLAEAVLEVASDPALRHRLQRGARRLAAATSWEAIAARHVELYRRLTG